MASLYLDTAPGFILEPWTLARPSASPRSSRIKEAPAIGRVRGANGWPDGTARHERSDPHPFGDRAGRSPGRRQLLPLVYDELRKLAAQKLAREQPGHTLDATALVHEAYLRLVGDQEFDNRGHFFAAAAEAMRRILVERARRKNRLRRGGGRARLDLEAAASVAEEPSQDLEALDDALDKLAAEDPAKAELVKLRFFAGLTMPEIAQVMNISLATADAPLGFCSHLALCRSPGPR